MRVVTEVPRLARRRPDVHKGDIGRILIVGGCSGMAGAPCLAANAAFRAGAGLVRMAVPETILNTCSILAPLATGTPLPASGVGSLVGTRFVLERLLNLAEDNDVLVVGPGLGREPATAALIRELVAGSTKPVVLDADGLRALGPNPHIAPEVADRLVLTPHPGEFAALTGSDTRTVQSDRKAAAAEFVRTTGTVLALKGHQTVVCDRNRLYVNTTGNPGMATGGSGDVLAGVIAALLGQKLAPYDAAVLGVCVHGLAGDIAAKKKGEVSLIATDIVDHLPDAFRTLGDAA